VIAYRLIDCRLSHRAIAHRIGRSAHRNRGIAHRIGGSLGDQPAGSADLISRSNQPMRSADQRSFDAISRSSMR